jgi:hypothetical protein
MKIYKVYLDQLEVKETTLKFAVDRLEGSGYWKKGTVKGLLENGQVVQNPFCMYANSEEALYKNIKNN